MHIIAVALILSILAGIASFLFVGIIPSIIALILNIICIRKEKSINTVRSLAISVVGILLPVIMYLNSYGFSLPFEKIKGMPMLSQILYDNYTRLGFNMDWMLKDSGKLDEELLTEVNNGMGLYYVTEGVDFDEEGVHVAEEPVEEASIDDAIPGMDIEIDESSIFEAVDSNSDAGKMEIGKSDDDMPSYGGLPIGTLIVGQYFREDDHNCNPILVLQNKTGGACRFECLFTARDEDGNELATSRKTVEAVKNDALFVFEGRFDKGRLDGKRPAMYEFLVSKRDPYEKDMADEVSVFSQVLDYSVMVTAQNLSDKKVKVDAYVLFFDGDELVDCIWMIPRNEDEVTVYPKSAAAIKADAYYRFDRVETYYTAYEAVEAR
ncbi:MAG: hypothetical protein K6F75_08665 [Butyrivibrio sp.]|nr:hypothetical protein [Butyrivibrio sp.]